MFYNKLDGVKPLWMRGYKPVKKKINWLQVLRVLSSWFIIGVGGLLVALGLWVGVLVYCAVTGLGF